MIFFYSAFFFLLIFDKFSKTKSFLATLVTHNFYIFVLMVKHFIYLLYMSYFINRRVEFVGII